VILALGLGEARRLGLSRVLLTSELDNVASRRTIERNAGVAGSHSVSPTTGRTMQQYWIDLTQPPRIRGDARDRLGPVPRHPAEAGSRD
jgi:hypothetical protein